MGKSLQGEWAAHDTTIAIVVSRFNDLLTGHMLGAALSTYERLGGDPQALTIAHVPGSLELAVTARKLAKSEKFESILCLGCIIRGDTDHYEHVTEQTAKGIREVGTQTGVPCIFGVITADTLEQAINRAGVKMGNQGEKAMLATVEMAQLMRKVPNEAKPQVTNGA